VYGLTEWNCDAIKNATLLANPGCYPTSIQLALLPLLKHGLLDSSVVGITSYSGTSGAGRSVTEKMMFGEVNESVRAYKVGNHQHIPEIRQYLKAFGGADVDFTFVPHLLPVTRGIYTTIHAKLNREVNAAAVAKAFNTSYESSPFVRVIAPSIPEMKDVLYTNFCDIGFSVDEEKQTIVILSTIDNLGKGAAGQAIQNMNIMFGLSQTEGLLPCYKRN
jgi:N-acetyl-gamma-glutamyl-phosphate reductase